MLRIRKLPVKGTVLRVSWYAVYPTSVVLVHHLYAIMTPVVKNIYILSVIMLYVRLYTVLTKERNGGLFNTVNS